MKKEILKIAGVKSEKEFYKKFPTEEAFMAKHGKELKKAQGGNRTNPIPSQYQITPINPYGGNVLNNATYNPSTGMFDSSTGQVSMADTQMYGFNNSGVQQTPKSSNFLKDLNANDIESGMKYTSTIGQNVQKISGAIQEKKKAKQLRALLPVVAKASGTRPEQVGRRYVRPEDMITAGEELAPIYGVGTNVLAKDGKTIGGIPGEIANTFAPNTLYDDLGYEPLNDSDRYKQFKKGGKIHEAQDGMSMGMIQEGINMAGDLAAGIINIGTNKINKQNQKLLNQTAFQSGMQDLQQGQYQSFMKDGGEVGDEYKWISHTWQPQKIVKFGEHKVKDLLKPPADADMLRAGGHLKEYTPPSERAMSTERPDMEEGGELQIHWGGDAEPMSYNPYLPDGGETIMFRGQSHEESDGKGNTGIGITYGDNPVEVERGEPAMKMKDGGDTSSLVVFGNLKIPHTLLGDPSAKGKNFKKYVAELSKTENRQNKLVEKSVDSLDNLEVQTPFDRLKFNSLDMNIKGANAKLKDIAQKKMDASALQSAMNDTIEEFKLKTTDKGTIQAKKGAKIPQAQDGINKTVTLPEIVVSPKNKFNIGKLDKLPKRDMTVPIPKTISTVAPELKVKPEMVKKDQLDLATYFNQVLPFLRPTDTEGLDPNQLMGEMFALSQNQLEPVQAQLFQPELSVPYDISLQDILNENEATFRAQQRMVGYNPSLQGQLAAQKYAANQKVLAEQFRMNQAMKDQIYRENRNLLNQAKLQNLATLDQQYQRQAQAKATTKATTQAALNSIAAKYAQNKLENRTLQVYENLYNYRFDPRFRAINMNPLFQATIPTISDKEVKAKSGKKVNLNSTVVKALKNI